MPSPADDAASVSAQNRPKEFDLPVAQISNQGVTVNMPSSTNSYFLAQPPPPAGLIEQVTKVPTYMSSPNYLTLSTVPQAALQAPASHPYMPFGHTALPSYADCVYLQHPDMARLAMVNNAAGYMYMGAETSSPTIAGAIHEDDDSDLPICHLHTKTQLSCRLCRKHRNAVNQKARLAAQQGNLPIRPAEDRRNVIEMTNTTSFGLNNLLQSNILSSEYFRSLFALKTFQEIVEEISRYANHAEPYLAGSQRSPSTFFCCLYKLFLMRLTDKQMRILLEHRGSGFVRAIGFLYLRYVHPPAKLWDWFEIYFLDDEEFTPSVDTTRIVTMGEYVETLLTEDKYFSTVLPRLPAKLKNQYGAQLITMAEHRTRKAQNKENIEAFVPNQAVIACHQGTWLEGILIDVIYPHAGRTSCEVQLKAKNEEEEPEEITVDIGLVILVPKVKRKHKEKRRKRDAGTRASKSPEQGEILEDNQESVPRRNDEGRKRSKGDDYNGHRDGRKSHRSRRRRKRSLSRSRGSSESNVSMSPTRDSYMAANIMPKQMSERDLRAEFKKRETDKVLATGKDYARRPASYKSSLSAKMTTNVPRRETRIPMSEEVDLRSHSTATPKTKPVEVSMPSRAHQAKMMSLMGKYMSGQEDQKETDDTEGVERLGYV
eukprot:GHVP01024305.1.p1 GENE.GHVP01024305.1~~GHVP01024305.1.p1  ORF type:complete len:656 (-),score=94.63 GHVP01024305.1:362-2329(-)